MNLLFAVNTRLRYIFTARHRKGFGIHSPYVFALINDVIREHYPYYSYAPLQHLRETLTADKTALRLNPTIGIPQRASTTVAREAEHGSKPTKYARLLQRLCSHNHATTIVELGTNLGLSTLHLAANSSKATVYTFEAQQTLAEIAKRNFELLKANNIQIIQGDIDRTLSPTLDRIDHIDIAYINADHRYRPTMQYYHKIKSKAIDNSIIVIDDPHRSPEMQKAWDEIKTDPQATLTIDLFRMGLVFFVKDLPKQHYTVTY